MFCWTVACSVNGVYDKRKFKKLQNLIPGSSCGLVLADLLVHPMLFVNSSVFCSLSCSDVIVSIEKTTSLTSGSYVFQNTRCIVNCVVWLIYCIGGNAVSDVICLFKVVISYIAASVITTVSKYCIFVSVTHSLVK